MEKKFLFIGMAAAVMLTGCSNDETMDVAQNKTAIEFSGFVNKSVRATDATTANLEAFTVSVLEKDGENFSRPMLRDVKKVSGEWTYSPTIFWEHGSNYKFVAYAPKSDNVAFTAPTKFDEDGSIAFTNTGDEDLIYATDATYETTAVSTENQCPAAINFTFNHLLSRVKFAFTNAMEDHSELKVTNVTITNSNTKGNVTLGTSASWALAEDNTPASLVFGNLQYADEATALAYNEEAATDHKYVMPVLAEDQAYTVTFTIERTHAGLTDTYNHSVTIPANAVTWAAGNSYLFTATINSENIDSDPENPDFCEIMFTATVTEWQDANWEQEGTEIPGYEVPGEEGTQGE